MAEAIPLVIDAATAAARLAAMLRNGFGAGLPKKRLDRYVLLAALAKLVAADEAPGEREVTGRLKAWLAGEGARLSTDAATLRRALIDEGFLERDGRGTAYRRSRAFERNVRFAAPPLSPAEQAARLGGLPGWTIETVNGEAQLVRVFHCADFAAALALAGRIGAAAEAADHHPALLVEWGRLTVRWWTHSTGGLGPDDFAMAASTDRLAAEA
jgi:4a-hydroxytetrahydrobiopterin dehydratase